MELDEFITGVLWNPALSLRGLDRSHVYGGLDRPSSTIVTADGGIEYIVKVKMDLCKLCVQADGKDVVRVNPDAG